MMMLFLNITERKILQSQPNRRYIFCGILNRGDGELRADKPMSTIVVMQKSSDIAPHDARRMLLTDILNNSGSVSDAQFIAGTAIHR